MKRRWSANLTLLDWNIMTNPESTAVFVFLWGQSTIPGMTSSPKCGCLRRGFVIPMLTLQNCGTMTQGIVFLMGCAISTSPDWATSMVGKWIFQKNIQRLKYWLNMRCLDSLRYQEVFRLCCNYINPMDLSLWMFMVMLCYALFLHVIINILSLCFTFHVLSYRPDLSCQKLPPGA